MKETRIVEIFDEEGRHIVRHITIHEDSSMAVGDRSKYRKLREAYGINENRPLQEVYEYDKYSRCMPKANYHDIFDAIEEFVNNVEKFNY